MGLFKYRVVTRLRYYFINGVGLNGCLKNHIPQLSTVIPDSIKSALQAIPFFIFPSLLI
jgi:hypothetical protein